MKIIERVTISKFRSFGIDETIQCNDLNIFSGANDSGKSNVLKALNLFFNNESDFNTRYNSEVDFNKWFRDNNERGQRNIEITLKIAKGNYHDKDGINEGFVVKKILYTNGGSDFDYFKPDGETRIDSPSSRKRANSIISERIQYLYVPAIRDRNFREAIQRKVQSIAESNDKRSKQSSLGDSISKVQQGLVDELTELKEHVRTTMGIEIEPNVNFATLLESMSFDTSEKIKIRKRKSLLEEKQHVSLNSRGEGIQMQFFSFLLWFIAKKDKKHFYIWGYEEPEIAFELKRQYEIYETYKNDFSKVAQIFITTHSPAFALSKEDKMSKTFRVSYEDDRAKGRYVSRIYPIEMYYEGLFNKLNQTTGQEHRHELERDIWGMNIQKISDTIGRSLNSVVGQRHIAKEELEEIKNKLEATIVEKEVFEKQLITTQGQLINLFPDRVFICEDEGCVKLWQELFNKCGIENVTVFSSRGCSSTNIETVLDHKRTEKNGYTPSVFRQLDRDGFTADQVKVLEEIKSRQFIKFKKYIVKFLPVYEIENFSIQILGAENILQQLSVEIMDKLSPAFYATASNNSRSAQKVVIKEKDLVKKLEYDKLFNSQEGNMYKDALLDKCKYFPGKDILRLLSKPKGESIIRKTTIDQMPIDLRIYLESIKAFFMEDAASI